MGREEAEGESGAFRMRQTPKDHILKREDAKAVAAAERRQNGLPHITCQSGALENNMPEDQGIRQQVCRILEGGSDAFRKRERRYALPEGQV